MTQDNPWVKKNLGKGTLHGRKAEDKAAKRFKAKLTPGSGNKGVKGDFEIGRFKIENKATIKQSLILKRDWLLKIKQESREVNKIPALAIQFVDGQGTSKKHGNWVMVEEDIFRQLLDNQQELL